MVNTFPISKGPQYTPLAVQTTVTYTAGKTSTLGVKFTDLDGKPLIARTNAGLTETVVASNPSIYTIVFPTFNPSKSGYIVWDDNGTVIQTTKILGPDGKTASYLPTYKGH